MAYLDIQHLHKRYGQHTVVHDFNMRVEAGEFVTFLGPSGCGKTTVLRMIAGFETPSGGVIRMQGEDITACAPQKRGIGMVFQSYALFPNMNAGENIAFGLKMQKRPAADIRRKVAEALALVELSGKEGHYPHQLSGGQRQRWRWRARWWWSRASCCWTSRCRRWTRASAESARADPRHSAPPGADHHFRDP